MDNEEDINPLQLTSSGRKRRQAGHQPAGTNNFGQFIYVVMCKSSFRICLPL
jgi:hypothetical protein